MEKRIEVWVLILIIFTGLAYGYYEYVLKEQIADIQRYQKLVEERRSERDTLYDIKQNKQAKLDKIAKRQAELAELDKAVPDSDDSADFNIQLYYIIKNLGLNVKNVEPGDIITANGYSGKNIRVMVNGSRNDIANFVDFLKKYPRKIKITSANIKVLNVNELQVEMNIQVFFIKA